MRHRKCRFLCGLLCLCVTSFLWIPFVDFLQHHGLSPSIRVNMTQIAAEVPVHANLRTETDPGVGQMDRHTSGPSWRSPFKSNATHPQPQQGDWKESEEMDGYERARQTHVRCNASYSRMYVPVSQRYSVPPSMQFCPVWKVGTTTIKRLFMLKNTPKYKNFSNPYAISFIEPYSEKARTMSNSKDQLRFMFVRNPYDRLFSAYVDKLLAPNPYYWKVLGVPAIQATRLNASRHSLTCGHDVTFSEFVTYAVQCLGGRVNVATPNRSRPKMNRDGHFETITNLCRPCDVKYDFVGKLEQFGTDVPELLKTLNLPDTDTLLHNNGSVLVEDDAIRDTTYQPFDRGFQHGFKLCNISRLKAFERSWLKLQVRGLIGLQNFTIKDDSLTYEQFLKVAMEARDKTTKVDRRNVKRAFFRSYYLSVSKSVRDALKMVYATDFRIFGYDNKLDLS